MQCLGSSSPTKSKHKQRRHFIDCLIARPSWATIINRAQALLFDLWHHRDSVGQIQFGTQSSPPRALQLLATMKQTIQSKEVPAEASNGDAVKDPSPSPPVTTTAAAPTLRLTKAPPIAAPPKKAPPKDPHPASSSTNPNQQYPNLIKGKVTKIREGLYVVPLRGSLHCHAKTLDHAKTQDLL